MATEISRPAAHACRHFRFGGVEIDETGRRLRIDGVETACPRLAFNLLLLLCESPGRIHRRSELQNRLWPGDQVVSDESLTQAIFRARAALGRYADCLVTVRGFGIRLDAAVRTSDAVPANDEESPESEGRLAGHEPTAAAGRRSPVHRGTIALLGAIALAAVCMLAWRGLERPRWIDKGYGLAVADAAASPASVAALRDAFAYDASGDRPRARALMEAIQAGDARTPIPPLMLALWDVGAGDGASAASHLADARARMASLSDSYLAAFASYVDAERRDDPRDTIRYAGAVLALRPQAWHMHLARAHLLLREGLREGALTELKAIDVRGFGDRKLESVLADRASLGDIEGAESALHALGGSKQSAAYAFIEGRILWSLRDLAGAKRSFEETVERGRRSVRLDLADRANVYLGAIALSEDDPAGSLAPLQSALDGYHGRKAIDEADVVLMLAQVQADLGQREAARQSLARASALVARMPYNEYAAMARLFAVRLGFADTVNRPAVADASATALLDASERLVDGDPEAARGRLAEAFRLGVDRTYLADEAHLLARELGLDPGPLARIDPPFPPLARFATRHAERVLASRRKPGYRN